MYDHNQLEIPASFMALFITPGHSRPNATREHIGARYELCEDLAGHLEPYARAQHFDLNIAQSDVLTRCHAGLLAPASGVSADEAVWVVKRLAELAEWPIPLTLAPPAADAEPNVDPEA